MLSSDNAFVHVVNLLTLQIESDLAKFDERDTSGATPAHYAAAQGNYCTVCSQCLKLMCDHVFTICTVLSIAEYNVKDICF